MPVVHRVKGSGPSIPNPKFTFYRCSRRVADFAEGETYAPADTTQRLLPFWPHRRLAPPRADIESVPTLLGLLAAES
jgi:hypothetical protein